MSRVAVRSRAVMAITGALWIAAAAVGFAQPQYWTPITAIDYAAMALFSAAMVGLGLSVRLLPTRGAARTAARVVAAAALTNGIANLLEDGVGLKDFGSLWVVSILALYVSLIALALLSFRAGMRAHAVVAALTLVGLAFITMGGTALTGATWLLFALGWPLAPSTDRARADAR